MARGWKQVRLVLAILSAGLGLAACGEISRATDEAFSRTGQLVAMSGGDGGAANACFTCHGLDGAGDGDAAPRLAGLDAGYLHKQLEDYASGLRRHDVMGEVARNLTPKARAAVAAWYAGLPPRAVFAAAPPAPIAYDACIACHGPWGEGAGAAGPALAGQPAAYLADQLRRWRRSERRNDPRGVMRTAAAGLSAADAAAIATWLSGLSAAPRPGSAAASVSAASAASEAPAASRASHRPDPRTGA